MTLSRARWWRLAAYLLLVAAVTLAFWRVEQTQRSQCEAFDTFARNLGAEIGADADRVERFIDQLHTDLDSC